VSGTFFMSSWNVSFSNCVPLVLSLPVFYGRLEQLCFFLAAVRIGMAGFIVAFGRSPDHSGLFHNVGRE
jgi:hypothetical protein